MTCCKTYKSKLSYSNRIMPSLSERSNKLWRNFLQYAEAKSRWRPDIIYRTQLRSNQSSRSSKKLIKTLSSCSQPRCGEQSGKVDESVQGALTNARKVASFTRHNLKVKLPQPQSHQLIFFRLSSLSPTKPSFSLSAGQFSTFTLHLIR